jgi:DUF1009 family protein
MGVPAPGTATADGPLAIICGGGTLPFAVADAVEARGRKAVLFAMRGWADENRVGNYRHHWAPIGQFGKFVRLAGEEGCRDVVFIGSLTRPAISQIRLDFATLKLLPKIVRAYRGGDNHLLSAVGRMFEERGFRLLGAHEVAPEILAPLGAIGTRVPSETDARDIKRGLALIAAIGPFDVGQAVVVAGNNVLAVEAAEGTDLMLERIAELRRRGRIASARGTGVLVKAPKPGQDRRFDLPTIGPQTVERVARAGIAGIAVIAGAAIVADAQEVARTADREGVFVAGMAGEAQA